MYPYFHGIISKTKFSISPTHIKRFWQKFKGDWRSKMYPCFYDIVLKILLKKIFHVSISSHEGLKLQSFESSVGDVIPANIQIILPLASYAYFCYFYEEGTFYTVLWSF